METEVDIPKTAVINLRSGSIFVRLKITFRQAWRNEKSGSGPILAVAVRENV